jgi:hypothetical protein
MVGTSGTSTRSRVRIAFTLPILVAGLLTLALPQTSRAATPALYDMAWGLMTDGSATARTDASKVTCTSGGQPVGDLRWIYPYSTSLANFFFSGAKPGFLRISQPLNVVRNPDGSAVTQGGQPCLETGNVGPSGAGTILDTFTYLKDHGTQIGASLSTTTNGQSSPGSPRGNPQMLTQAKYISNQTDEHGQPLYSFLFLDHSGQLPHQQQQDLVSALGNAQNGGWTRVMTNDTPYHPENDPNNNDPDRPPSGEWAHAHQLTILTNDDGKDQATCNANPMLAGCWMAKALAAAQNQRPAITNDDTAFINWVNTNDPGSKPVLKLEISSGTDHFAQLPLWAQCSLLSKWANGQVGVPAYKFIYPLYAPANPPDQTHPYDSVYQGSSGSSPNCDAASQSATDPTYGGSTFTFNRQASLISTIDDPGPG